MKPAPFCAGKTARSQDHRPPPARVPVVPLGAREQAAAAGRARCRLCHDDQRPHQGVGVLLHQGSAGARRCPPIAPMCACQRAAWSNAVLFNLASAWQRYGACGGEQQRENHEDLLLADPLQENAEHHGAGHPRHLLPRPQVVRLRRNLLQPAPPRAPPAAPQLDRGRRRHEARHRQQLRPVPQPQGPADVSEHGTHP